MASTVSRRAGSLAPGGRSLPSIPPGQQHYTHPPVRLSASTAEALLVPRAALGTGHCSTDKAESLLSQNVLVGELDKQTHMP